MAWDGFTNGSATLVVRTPVLRDAVVCRFLVYAVVLHLPTVGSALAIAMSVRA